MSITILNREYDILTTKELNLMENYLDTIPESIGSLINLQYLYLHGWKYCYK